MIEHNKKEWENLLFRSLTKWTIWFFSVIVSIDWVYGLYRRENGFGILEAKAL